MLLLCLCLSILPSFSFAYSFDFTNTPKQCGNLSLSVTGPGGQPPYSILLIPYGPSTLPNNIEARRITQQNFSGTDTTLSFQLKFPSNTQFVAVVSLFVLHSSFFPSPDYLLRPRPNIRGLTTIGVVRVDIPILLGRTPSDLSYRLLSGLLHVSRERLSLQSLCTPRKSSQPVNVRSPFLLPACTTRPIERHTAPTLNTFPAIFSVYRMHPSLTHYIFSPRSAMPRALAQVELVGL